MQVVRPNMQITMPSQDIKQVLICPLSNKPLKNAVTVFPCGDNINQKSAVLSLGLPIEGGCKIEKGRVCPVCTNPAEGYVVNNSIRQAAHLVFSAPNKNNDPVFTAFFGTKEDQQKFEEHAKMKKIPNLQKIEIKLGESNPYPGKSSIFEHVEGDWLPLANPKGEICRTIRFKTSLPTINSLIKSFEFSGTDQGTVHLLIGFAPSKAEKIENYFAGLGWKLPFSTYEKEAGLYMTANEEDLKVVFEELAVHNTIPPKYLPMLEAIAETGKIPRTEIPKKNDACAQQ